MTDVNLETELKKRQLIYKKELSVFYKRDFLWISILFLAVSFGFLFGLTRLVGFPLSVDWRFAAFINWLILVIPPYLLFHPKKPTMGDVELDEQLKKLGEKIKNKH